MPGVCSSPGQYALDNGDGTFTCTACKSGYYRSGDATPENNVCKPIPAGYREKTTSDAAGTVAQSEIVPCELGTFSAWDSDPTNPAGTAARTPSGATVCQACATNFYAPRRGELGALRGAGWVIQSESACCALLRPQGCSQPCTGCCCCLQACSAAWPARLALYPPRVSGACWAQTSAPHALPPWAPTPSAPRSLPPTHAHSALLALRPPPPTMLPARNGELASAGGCFASGQA